MRESLKQFGVVLWHAGKKMLVVAVIAAAVAVLPSSRGVKAQEAPLGLEGSSELAEKIDGEEYGFPGYDLVLAGGDQDCLTTTVGDLRGRGHARVSPQALAAWHDARGGLRYSIQNLAYCMTGSALVQPFTVEITYNNTTEAVLAKLPHPFFVIDPAQIPSGSIEVREDCKPDGRYWSEVWIPVKKKEK
jgi:hypothetical protein